MCMLARLVVVYHPCDLVHEGLLRRFLNLFFSWGTRGNSMVRAKMDGLEAS